jgi:formylglycine-generating enzyme required for sulfatase activity
MPESRKNGGESNGAPAVYLPEAVSDTHESEPGDGGKPDAKADDVLKKGDVLGRYLVLEPLGAGAMGVVYAAYDPELDRKIAIKILRPQEGKGDRARRQERLVREAKAMAKLSHPNVGAIYDVGVHGDQVFLAMEFLSGGTLRDWITAKKRPWREIVKMFIEVGKGLAGAHAEGLIHRDFKPDNVLLDKNGVPKVVDFGLVRLTSAALDQSTTGSIDADATDEGELSTLPVAKTALAAALTRTGALTGTPAYMAPEQFLGKPIDAKTDQFAFCIALYEALYGERPFAGDTIIGIADSVTSGRIGAAPKTDVPSWVRASVLRGLSVEPGLRWSSMDDQLARLARDPSIRQRRVVGATAVAAVLLVAVALLMRQADSRRRRLEAELAAQVDGSKTSLGAAHRAVAEGRRARQQAFDWFDRRSLSEGESAWHSAYEAFGKAKEAFTKAQTFLQGALVLDPGRADLDSLLEDTVFEHTELVEELHDEGAVDALVRTFPTIDRSGRLLARWNQPNPVSIVGQPEGSSLTIGRYDKRADGTITLGPLGVAPSALPAGSYLLIVAREGRTIVRQTFTVGRGATTTVIAVPPPSNPPEGFVYVPEGDCLFGEADESVRASLDTTPIRSIHVTAFLIARDETTYGQWIEFLDHLPADQRKERTPRVNDPHGAVELRESAPHHWELSLRPTTRTLKAMQGEKLTYPERSRRARQDWTRFPVSGVSSNDAAAYIAWLKSSGRVPKARLCSEREWERAARGADDRAFPHGNLLLPDDADIDVTYSRRELAFGPDEVGSHPASDSPFGVSDLAGNIIEMTTGLVDFSPIVARGGAYYWDKRSARATNREAMEPSLRYPTLGIRVCADI